ncbi:MAG: type II secretion system protein [Sedimentisphaerales bacterium]|nr:type II secretion system protein [Sedimentisphaerales bacterium]
MVKQQKMPKSGEAFTLTELMVVILIVAILVAVTTPFIQGRVDKAKWSEACTTAGFIRKSVRNYIAESGLTAAEALLGTNLGNRNTRNLLGFHALDCEGTYFESDDYTITSVESDGTSVITVTGGSKANSPSGTYVMQANGTWSKQT